MNEDPATQDPSPADAPSADDGNLFAVALAKNNNESFPVLNAFQRFLDQERERARRRVVTMAVCFTGAMVVMLLVFGILFATFFSRMMVRNERQQDRLLDLVVAGLPGAARPEPAPAAAPAPAPKEEPSAVTREELLEILRQMNAAQSPAAPAAPTPVGEAGSVPGASVPGSPAPAPGSIFVDIPVVPVPAAPEPAAAPAPKPRKTGVISSPLRQDQEAKEAAEDAARRARAAAKAEAEKAAAAAAAAAAAPAPEPAPAREAGSVPGASAPGSPAAPSDGIRTIAVKPRSRMKVPEGFSTDRAELQTSTGASVPFRLLVPVPDASR